jgi:hypothetical protein
MKAKLYIVIYPAKIKFSVYAKSKKEAIKIAEIEGERDNEEFDYKNEEAEEQ